MTTSDDDRWVGVIRGAATEHARQAGLSGGALGLYRHLIETANRHTGVLNHVTVAELAEGSRYSRKAVRGYLADLEAAGLVKVELRQGHGGRITLLRHDEVVYQRNARGGSRQSAHRSRQSTQPSRRSTRPSRQSTRATSPDTDREREERESSSNSLSGARSGGSAGATPPGGARPREQKESQMTDPTQVPDDLAVEVEDTSAVLEVFEDDDNDWPLVEAFDAELGRHGWWDHLGEPVAELSAVGIEGVRRAVAEVRAWMADDDARAPAWLPWRAKRKVSTVLDDPPASPPPAAKPAPVGPPSPEQLAEWRAKQQAGAEALRRMWGKDAASPGAVPPAAGDDLDPTAPPDDPRRDGTA